MNKKKESQKKWADRFTADFNWTNVRPAAVSEAKDRGDVLQADQNMTGIITDSSEGTGLPEQRKTPKLDRKETFVAPTQE